MADFIDMNQICFTPDGRPTAYFESIWAQVVRDLGGEAQPSVPDQIELAKNFQIEAQAKTP